MMRAVEVETQGQMQIRIGSLYGSVRRMMEAGLIEETHERPDPDLDDERRRYYGVTPFGRQVLTAEAARVLPRRWPSSRGKRFWVRYKMRAVLGFSERLYSLLLCFYPRRFRAAYGQQMRQTFRDACGVAHRRSGVGGVLALWPPTLLDLFRSALEERAQQGEIRMFKARLMTMAGPLTVLVGALWLLAALGDFVFRIGLQGNEAFLGLVTLPFFLSFIPLLFALLGIRRHFHPIAGGLGRLGYW